MQLAAGLFVFSVTLAVFCPTLFNDFVNLDDPSYIIGNGGVHTGVNEAIPAVKFMGQLFDHLGFTIIDEWYLIGDFKDSKFKGYNSGGRLGDISGRPDARDLQKVAQQVKAIPTV